MSSFLDCYRPVDVQLNDIRQLLASPGVSMWYAGFETTAIAIKMITQDPSKLIRVTRRLYYDVADEQGVTPASIERRIRHTAEMAWDCNPEHLEELTGCYFPECPTSTQFLGGLAFYYLIKREEKASA